MTQPPEQKLPTITPSQGQKEQLVLLTLKLGSPYFQEKYFGQWKKSLNSCSVATAKFLRENTGLFHVEVTTKLIRISLEVANTPDLKSKLKELYKQSEIKSAFSHGFGKEAKVMLRLA